MVESERKEEWKFKQTRALDMLQTKSGSRLRIIAEMAGKSAELSWKEVQNMPIKDFMRFLNEYSKSQGLDEFEGYDFLGQK